MCPTGDMLTCPSCGQENPAGFRFCGACGTSLAAEPPAGREELIRVVPLTHADLPKLRPGEPRRVPVLRRVRHIARRRASCEARGAKGRHRPLLRPGRLDGTR